MTSRNVLFSAAVTLAIVLSFSACGLQTGGIPGGLGGGAGEEPLTCAVDGHCDDGNPCTDDKCDTATGVCRTPVALKDGPLPSALQTAGDCHTLFCKSGEPSSETDDKDFLADDNDCTVDQCSSGKPLHAVEQDGSACLINHAPGSCKTGECVVECGAGKPPCDDGQACTTDACDGELGKCTFIPLVEGAGTPGSSDDPGNCKVDVCVGGKATVLTDNSDTPSASGDCQIGKCDMGSPSSTKFAVNTGCNTNGGKFCDGAGLCVECNSDGQCGPTNECQLSVCTNHACVVTFTPVNTAVMNQQSGDCKKNVCDGAGAIISINDDMDTQGDGNPCTDDICAGGVLSHPKSAIDTVCGAGLVCNGNGGCVGCTVNAMCNAPATCGGCGVAGECCCKPKTCADLNLHCGSAPDQCGGMVVCNDGKNFGETDVDCGGATCSVKCAQGKLCTANSDCATNFCADGRCCDGACGGACLSCNLPGNVGNCTSIVSAIDNNPANICSGNNICDATGLCKKIVGQGCAADSECASGACADGVCCGTACNGTCKSCNIAGSVGTCSNIASGSPDNNATVVCNVTNTCDGSGNCKKIDGQVCAAGSECFHPNCVDGVCCNVGCGGACLSCNLAGTVGTCTNVPLNGTDNNPACNGNNACNGSGSCKKINGQGCAAGGECVSNACADTVCCNSTCGTACRSCNLAGTVGTCSNITSGTDNTPANICIAPNACDAAGNCKKANGQGCAANSECVSNACVDSVCCGSAACGACQACNLNGMGSCSNIAANSPDNIPAGTCTGSSACDGMGACKLKNGQVCGADGTMCVSGICADTLCCNNACGLVCQACNLGGASNGTCTNITSGTDADTCTGTSTCNAASQCKKNNGQGCAAGSECLNGNCVDGTCCGSASCGICQSCSLNGNGTCSFIASGSVDSNSAPLCDATTSSTCNGAGVCKKLDGQVCGAPTDCFSGNCIDGVCCNVACMGNCNACNIAGSVGTCGNVPVGQQDNTATTPCVGNNACDGAGVCKLKNGQSCAGGAATCASGTCADLVCCDTACSGTCQSCTNFLKVSGPDGICGFTKIGADPDLECTLPATCNGSGMCQ